jgi:hypothetical protein
VNIDSVVVSWNPSKKQYTITMLTRNDELILKYAADMPEAIATLKELEEKYAA